MNKLVLIVLIGLFVIGAFSFLGVFNFNQTKQKEFNYPEYKNITPTFSEFPSDFKESRFYTSCKSLLTKSKALESKTPFWSKILFGSKIDETIYASKIACMYNLYAVINALAKNCNVTLVEKTETQEETRNKVKSICGEDAQCMLKYVGDMIKNNIEILKNNAEKCTKIDYENKNEAKREFINYLNWVEGFVDYVINY